MYHVWNGEFMHLYIFLKEKLKYARKHHKFQKVKDFVHVRWRWMQYMCDNNNNRLFFFSVNNAYDVVIEHRICVCVVGCFVFIYLFKRFFTLRISYLVFDYFTVYKLNFRWIEHFFQLFIFSSFWFTLTFMSSFWPNPFLVKVNPCSEMPYSKKIDNNQC